MKKKYILLLFLIFVVKFYAQNKLEKNNYKFTYNYTYQIDSTDINYTKTVELLLYVTNKKSVFYSKSKAIRDSIFKGMTVKEAGGREGLNSLLKQARNAGAKKIYYHKTIIKDRITLGLIYYEKIFHNLYTYKENYILPWKLVTGNKEIAGYNCYKALLSYAGRDYIAWYTTAIPISDGPEKFRGLPGLILEVYDTKNQHHFTINKISKSTANFPTIPKRNLVKITPRKLFKERITSRKEMIKTVLMMTSNVSPEQKNALKKRNRRNNNPIELKFDYYIDPKENTK